MSQYANIQHTRISPEDTCKKYIIFIPTYLHSLSTLIYSRETPKMYTVGYT